MYGAVGRDDGGAVGDSQGRRRVWPLYSDYPQKRLAFTLEDTHTPVLRTQGDLVARLPMASASSLLCLDHEWDMIAGVRIAPGTAQATAANLPYIIYTSSSAETPYGVLIQHQGLPNLEQVQQQAFDVQANSLRPAIHPAEFRYLDLGSRYGPL
jgi:non-ribosomal peptide synthetase component F